MLNTSERDDLEGLIDHYGLSDVIETLSYLAHEKADHLLSNWQDKVAAKSWTRDANKLATLATKLEN